MKINFLNIPNVIGSIISNKINKLIVVYAKKVNRLIVSYSKKFNKLVLRIDSNAEIVIKKIGKEILIDE